MTVPWDGRPQSPERDGVRTLARNIVRAYSRDDRREPNSRDMEIAAELHSEIAAQVEAAARAMREAAARHIAARIAGWNAEGDPEDEEINNHFTFAAQLLLNEVRALPLPDAALRALAATAGDAGEGAERLRLTIARHVGVMRGRANGSGQEQRRHVLRQVEEFLFAAAAEKGAG